MQPQGHIKRFLEEIKTRYSLKRCEDFQCALSSYGRFLERQLIRSIHVAPCVIDQYLATLYRQRCYAERTIANHARHIRGFYHILRQKDPSTRNPVRGKTWDIKPLNAKERSYTNEEITRAFTQDFRMMDERPILYPELEKTLNKITKWLNQSHRRLQSLKAEDLIQFARDLENYRKADGASLSYKVKLEYFQYIRWITRWCYRNGYRADHPGEGLQFTFNKIRIPPNPETISKTWAPYKDRFYQDHLGLWRPATFHNKEKPLKEFFSFLEENAIEDPNQITVEILERYKNKIYSHDRLSESSKFNKTVIMRTFMDWLEKKDHILTNPARKITWPKKGTSLPTRLMSEHELKTLINAPDLGTPRGLRDRAIFELMYSTGARRTETSSIKLEDIDYERGLIRINHPKGGSSFKRVIPIGRMALEWIKKYIDEARIFFPKKTPHEKLLFLTHQGRPIATSAINNAMHEYAFKQGMRKKYSSHSWRVTCATDMLNNHADIRYVQEQLGHRSLESTKIYTRVCPMDLKKIHTKTHPREKEYRKLTSSVKTAS